MTHTKGPWTADRKGTHGVANYTVIGTPANFHTEIARVYHGDRFADGEANARLIAAAPEMLKALRSVVAEHEGDDEENFMPLPTMELVRAAITKAEGRS